MPTDRLSGRHHVQQALSLLGIPLNRTVSGTIRARIAHESQGCGGRTLTRVTLREELRTLVGATRLLDVWGDGTGLLPPPATQLAPFGFRARARYSARFHQCVLDNYRHAAGGDHPLADAYRAHIEQARELASAPVGAPKARPLVILVKREGSRRVLNHDELSAALGRLPVDLQVLRDGFHVRDAWRLYHNASVVVAPHGAAQFNTVLAPPGVHVLEFIPFSNSNLVFYDLACHLGHNHSFLMIRNSSAASALHVDVGRVVQELGHILAAGAV